MFRVGHPARGLILSEPTLRARMQGDWRSELSSFRRNLLLDSTILTVFLDLEACVSTSLNLR